VVKFTKTAVVHWYFHLTRLGYTIGVVKQLMTILVNGLHGDQVPNILLRSAQPRDGLKGLYPTS
jgi:hypothetical protein